MCIPASALSFDSHHTCLPGRCPPVSLITPSSHRSLGSGERAGSARIPARVKKDQQNKVNIVVCDQQNLIWTIHKDQDRPFHLAECGTKLMSLQSQYGSL